MYRADLETHTTTTIELPDGIIFDDPPIAPDDVNQGALNGSFFGREITRRFVPATGYKYV